MQPGLIDLESRHRPLEQLGVPYRSHIHAKGQVGKPLSEAQQRANKKRSSVRVRVEHVFASHIQMTGDFVRTIGHARARLKFGLINMAYNMKRWGYLEEAAA